MSEAPAKSSSFEAGGPLRGVGLRAKVAIAGSCVVLIQTLLAVLWVSWIFVDYHYEEHMRAWVGELDHYGELARCEADPRSWRASNEMLGVATALRDDGRGYASDEQRAEPVGPLGPPKLESPRSLGREFFVYDTGRAGRCRRLLVLRSRDLPPILRAESRPVLLVRVLIDAVAVVFLVLLISAPLIRRLRSMAVVAERSAAGGFDEELPESGDELGQLAAAFNQATRTARERLELLHERDRALRETLANLAHDVRTPMSALKLGLGAANLDPQEGRALRAEVEHLDALFANLDTLARFETATIPLTREPTRLDSILERVALRLSVIAEDKGLRLELALPDEGPVIDADPVALEQAVGNLVHNAVKFAREEVTLGCFELGEEVVISVRDDGGALDLAELPTLAERGKRGRRAADRDRGRPGQGLGLAIAREIVERHGGHLRLALDDSGGTLATLTLPCPRI
ncbi:HAMP domain-containing histidine kinase [Pseudenhygromyxa sp. WMMC2535]|uniref:HAMP domain-containing sensor histidine kinase n=1 Tax=Pseudenhygromyxa sp. WMMC2535 TaxID=2712867 RepID=UPI0015571A0A|nr:HAMP domain-containing sensor histidine kinase [Pseudenhygromyxa sp. WMMC2535]NVB41366.1 HAMP domain-containing histidine kinase [Pseudenhygromyxa sp. WMMC2535]